MNEQRDTRISKYLARHLRHDPARIGIRLDEHGWVDIDELIGAAAAHGFRFSRAELAEVVATNDKRRYVIDADGVRIRAQQGHSVEVDLGLPPVEPPEWLYHGTVGRVVGAIREEGLRAMARHDVHLSPDRETAVRVGARRGRPVVLPVAAGAMHRDGHAFRVTGNGVWLVAAVPPAYVSFPG
ncbi:RNA 2'-phosphotransferase [Streptomyces sp. NPDC054796]